MSVIETVAKDLIALIPKKYELKITVISHDRALTIKMNIQDIEKLIKILEKMRGEINDKLRSY